MVRLVCCFSVIIVFCSMAFRACMGGEQMRFLFRNLKKQGRQKIVPEQVISEFNERKAIENEKENLRSLVLEVQKMFPVGEEISQEERIRRMCSLMKKEK